MSTQPLEYNLELAHKALVNAKYALHAIAGSTELEEGDKNAAQSYAEITDALVSRVHAMRMPEPTYTTCDDCGGGTTAGASHCAGCLAPL